MHILGKVLPVFIINCQPSVNMVHFNFWNTTKILSIGEQPYTLSNRLQMRIKNSCAFSAKQQVKRNIFWCVFATYSTVCNTQFKSNMRITLWKREKLILILPKITTMTPLKSENILISWKARVKKTASY